MTQIDPTPSELRSMFGRNLRILSAHYASISDLARQLGINRTQFNRYLSGESFPRPDILARICRFFDVDARILLDPVETLTAPSEAIGDPFLRGFVGAGIQNLPEDLFPSGFYRFSRRSFVDLDTFVVGMVHVRRIGRSTFLRGFETKEAMRMQGLPEDGPSREFRGQVMQQEDGVALLVARLNAMTCSFNFLSKVASFQNNFWVGYLTRTVPEATGDLRAARLAYEHLGTSLGPALDAARIAGFRRADQLPPFHARLLKPGTDFH